MHGSDSKQKKGMRTPTCFKAVFLSTSGLQEEASWIDWEIMKEAGGEGSMHRTLLTETDNTRLGASLTHKARLDSKFIAIWTCFCVHMLISNNTNWSFWLLLINISCCGQVSLNSSILISENHPKISITQRPLPLNGSLKRHLPLWNTKPMTNRPMKVFKEI